MNQWLKEKLKVDPIKKIQSFLATELALVDQVIKKSVEGREEVIPVITEYIFSAGGKRIRPILTLLSTKLFGYKGDSHINLSAAIEFIHTATLLHDDVVDQSELRRGRPSANNKWNNKTSVLVGDFLFSQAFCIMARTGDLAVLSTLSRASAIIAEGEVMQVKSTSNLHVTLDEYIEVVKAKTAELFAAACQIGAIISKRPAEEEMALKNFGSNLGIAFQIMDDALDYASDELSLGKSIGDDYKEGKVTLPIIFAYEKSNSEEREFLQKIFKNLDQEPDDFTKLLYLLDKYNVLNEVQDLAQRYVEDAKKNMQVLPDSDTKKLMLEILNFSIRRKY